MPTSEAELRVWSCLSVQEKAAVIVAFYVASALFPWITATAVFAFLAGRACGIQVGKLNAEIEQENNRAMRSKIIAEMATRNKKSMPSSSVLTPIPESLVLQREDEEEIEEEIEEGPDDPEGEQGMGEEEEENKENNAEYVHSHHLAG